MVRNASQFLNDLKQQTSTLHTALENLPVSLTLTSSALTRKDYTTYLSLMYKIICDVEREIFPIVCDVITDCEERKKAYLIKKDLDFFNYKYDNYSFSFKAKKNNLSEAFVLGIMYVIEGSTLGGRFIQKNAGKVLKIDEEHGCSYFAGYKNKTGKLWLDFLNMLSAFATDNNKEEEIILGAQYAFNEIYNLLKQAGNTNED